MEIRFSRIVVANGSNGTHAGLVAGLAAMELDPRRVQAFTVLAPLAEAQAATLTLARATLALITPDRDLDDGDILIDGSARGEGYGIPTDSMLEAVVLMARTEGLLLDPVYSGKAFAGLLAAIRRGALSEQDAVLFVMTGGVPGLYAYEPAFRERRLSGRDG